MNELELEEELLNRELAQLSLKGCIDYTFDDYIFGSFHDELFEALEAVERGDLKRLIVQMPPRSGKTEIISKRFPAWVLGRNPDKKIIGTSYGSELATKNSRETRRIVQQKRFRNIFPAFGLSDEKKESGNWETMKGGGYYSVGVGGALTGFGFDIGIIDDYTKNREEAESPTIREKTWDWYTSTFYTRKQGEDSAIILLATRWHEDDLIGRILKNDDAEEWKVINFPALNEKEESFFPERFSTEYYRDERNIIGVRDFAALYQQDPITAMGSMFKKEDFRYFALSDIDKIKERFDVGIIVDPAFSSRTSSDDTVIIALAKNRDTGELYELDRFADTIPPSKAVPMIGNMALKWKAAGFHVQFISVEDVSINKDQRLFVADVDKYLRDNQIMIPLKRFNPKGKKADRIRFKIEPVIARGGYYFRVDDPGNRAWIRGEEQLLRFPTGKHDDIIDTIAQGIDQFEKTPDAEKQMNALALKRRQVAMYKQKLIRDGVKL